MLERPPDTHPPPDAGKQRRRRAQKAASARRGRRGEYFFRVLVTSKIRARMVDLGFILERETDDRALVLRAIEDLILRDVLHLKF
jgi:hypothetical protein